MKGEEPSSQSFFYLRYYSDYFQSQLQKYKKSYLHPYYIRHKNIPFVCQLSRNYLHYMFVKSFCTDNRHLSQTAVK